MHAEVNRATDSGWRYCFGSIVDWFARARKDACIDARLDRAGETGLIGRRGLRTSFMHVDVAGGALQAKTAPGRLSNRWIILITIDRYYLIHRLIWCLLDHLGYLAVQIRGRRRGGGGITHWSWKMDAQSSKGAPILQNLHAKGCLRRPDHWIDGFIHIAAPRSRSLLQSQPQHFFCCCR